MLCDNIVCFVEFQEGAIVCSTFKTNLLRILFKSIFVLVRTLGHKWQRSIHLLSSNLECARYWSI